MWCSAAIQRARVKHIFTKEWERQKRQQNNNNNNKTHWEINAHTFPYCTFIPTNESLIFVLFLYFYCIFLHFFLHFLFFFCLYLCVVCTVLQKIDIHQCFPPYSFHYITYNNNNNWYIGGTRIPICILYYYILYSRYKYLYNQKHNQIQKHITLFCL